MDFDLVDEIYSDLNNLKVSSSFPYEQPYTLTEIKKARPSGPRRFDSIEDKDLLDKFHGAWTGRAVGCALGKPDGNSWPKGVDRKGGDQRIS